MGLVTVRVRPRSSRPAVRLDEQGILVRVRSAPKGGRATEEARRALAAALGVPGPGVRLRRGTRSRVKVFEVDGLGQVEAEVRLRATGGD
ncbi:MAG TPA: DUF167 family protein [Actinomycetota bacterium]|nr:DUF167 family protein [Actinomycetota bacterium]